MSDQQPPSPQQPPPPQPPWQTPPAEPPAAERPRHEPPPSPPIGQGPGPAETAAAPSGGPTGPVAAETVTTRAPLCSNGKRFGAYLLEALLVFVTLIIGWWIWAVIVWRDGQTPAKSLLKMRCVRTDTGETANWGTMALREVVGKFLLGSVTSGITTLISAVMILFDDQRQGIWDKIASTVVVDEAAAGPTSS